MDLEYLLLDVFTREALKGNQLAVITNGDGLLDNEMQAIATEFNLSETVFLRKPDNELNTASVRIFTPRVELPFAGHPTVGAAVVLAMREKISVVRIEEQVGLVTALVENADKTGGDAKFGLPRLPEEVARAPGPGTLALSLGISHEDIGCGPYRAAVYSAGTAFYLVPVRNAQVLRSIRLERRGWQEVFPVERHSVYVFTETPDEAGIDFAARMFSPGLGLGEDPGTGSAAAALVGLISRNASFGDGQAEYVLRQGYEMGRPCQIGIQLRKDAGILTHAGIGGHALLVGGGRLRF